MGDELDQWRFANQSRFPSGFLDKRLHKENRKAASLTQHETHGFQRWFTPRRVIKFAVNCSGFKHIGAKNASNIQKRINALTLPHLPDAFEGFRILHISDPHFKSSNAISDALFKSIENIECDLCVLTGDYRYRSFGQHDDAIDGLSKVRERLSCDIVAILGNHDSISMVPAMESIGITVLLNESFVVSKGNNDLTLVGVDDPSYYKFDDLNHALSVRPLKPQSAAILLAHSPNLADQAAQAGFSAYLCGHTHGGQICLPGSIPIRVNKNMPKYMNSGSWNYNGMSGYTSVGAGVSVVEARFFCPPEITIHVLSGKNDTEDGGN